LDVVDEKSPLVQAEKLYQAISKLTFLQTLGLNKLIEKERDRFDKDTLLYYETFYRTLRTFLHPSIFIVTQFSKRNCHTPTCSASYPNSLPCRHHAF
jgi:hypothetical protein